MNLRLNFEYQMLSSISIAHFDNTKDAYQELILQQFTPLAFL